MLSRVPISWHAVLREFFASSRVTYSHFPPLRVTPCTPCGWSPYRKSSRNSRGTCIVWNLDRLKHPFFGAPIILPFCTNKAVCRIIPRKYCCSVEFSWHWSNPQAYMVLIGEGLTLYFTSTCTDALQIEILMQSDPLCILVIFSVNKYMAVVFVWATHGTLARWCLIIAYH